MTIPEMEVYLNGLIRDALDESWLKMWDLGAWYLYYTPSIGPEGGRLHIALEAPEGALLAWTERLSLMRTREQTHRWIRAGIGALPILPFQHTN